MKNEMRRRCLLLCLLFAMSLLHAVSATLHDYARTITLMIGDSVTVSPQFDCGLTNGANYVIRGCTYSVTYNDYGGLTITPTKLTDTGTHVCYKYDIYALKRGTYQMTVTSNYYYVGASGSLTVKAVYNINVVDVTKINMPTALNLQPGDTYTLTPQILETGATSDLTWTSSNTGVAIVDNTGTIRCLRVGTTNITCTAYNGVSATCKLTVVPIIATNFELEETSYEIDPNETVTLSPVFTPANTTDQSVTYKSSDTKVATVDSDGVVTGVNMGTCTITASTNDGSFLSATCEIRVKPVVTSIDLDAFAELTVGESLKLTPSILQEGAVTTLSWTSSKPSVAKVSDDGTIYAASAGTATITCTASNGVSALCEVTVKPLENYLYIEDCTGLTGSQFTIPVMMKNEKDIVAFQFELSLPNGISMTKCELTERKGSNHTVSFSNLDNGNYQIVGLSSTSQSFIGKEGALVQLTLNVKGNMERGEYGLAIKNIELTSKTGVAINPIDMMATLSISDVMKADVNGDGKVTITDAVGIVNYILGNASASFHQSVADVNGDGKISITDAVAIVNIILRNN